MASVFTEHDIRTLLNQDPPLLSGLIDPAVQVQPNGVDLSLKAVYQFKGAGTLDFSNTARQLPETTELQFDAKGWLPLAPGCYLVQFNEVVNLPQDVMALARPRSSMLRVGATVESAVWDAGYCGQSQSLLVVYNPQGLHLQQNARILQLVFFRLGTKTNGYQGIYQGENL
ncbi:MAG: deoxyuridine 5'-triphosphate nucleotidohydrolase [Gemmatimonadetes bacterium]|nr:MAG: deoxyuridine 5'-triphosphate nucleotidohydrolase [Gemmatimonadota bacterium]